MTDRDKQRPGPNTGQQIEANNSLEVALADALGTRVNSVRPLGTEPTEIDDRDLLSRPGRSSLVQRAAAFVLVCGLAMTGTFVTGWVRSSGSNDLAATYAPDTDATSGKGDSPIETDSSLGTSGTLSLTESAVSTAPLALPTLSQLRSMPDPGPAEGTADGAGNANDVVLWTGLALPDSLASTGFRDALFVNGAYVISNGRDIWVLDEESAKDQLVSEQSDQASWGQVEVPDDHVVQELLPGSGTHPGATDWLRLVTYGPMSGDVAATVWSVNGDNQIDDSLTIGLMGPGSPSSASHDLSPSATPPSSSWSDFAVWSGNNQPLHAVVNGTLVLAQGFSEDIDGEQILTDRGVLPEGAMLCEFLTTGTTLTIAFSVKAETDLACLSAPDQQRVTYDAAALDISDNEMRWLSGLGPESSVTTIWAVDADGRLSPLGEVPGLLQRLDVTGDTLVISAFGRDASLISYSNQTNLGSRWTTLELPGSRTIGSNNGMVVLPLYESDSSMYWIDFAAADSNLGTLRVAEPIHERASSVGRAGVALVFSEQRDGEEPKYGLWTKFVNQPWVKISTNRPSSSSELHVIVGASSALLVSSDLEHPLSIQITNFS